jgi:hypothetical protein
MARMLTVWCLCLQSVSDSFLIHYQVSIFSESNETFAVRTQSEVVSTCLSAHGIAPNIIGGFE